MLRCRLLGCCRSWAAQLPSGRSFDTVNIDFLVTGLAIGWALLTVVWLDRRHTGWAGAAVVLGSLAMLMKPIDAEFWLTQALLYRSAAGSAGWIPWIKRRIVTVLGIAVVPTVLGLLWSMHADAIKSASLATGVFTSKVVLPFELGTLQQRFSVTDWSLLGNRLASTGLPSVLLIALVVLVCIRAVRTRSMVWLGVVLAAVLPVVVFFNGYVKNR